MDNSECATRCVCRYMSYTGLCTLLSQSLVIAVAAGYGVTSPFSEMLQHKVCSLQGGPCIYLPEVWCWLPVLDKQRHSCSLGMHPCCTIPLTHVLDKAFLPILLTAVQAGVAGLPGKPACHAFQYEMTCCLQCMALAGLYIITTSALDRVSSTAMLPGPIWLSLYALVPALKAGFVLWAFVSLFITTRKLQAQNLPAKLHLYR